MSTVNFLKDHVGDDLPRHASRGVPFAIALALLFASDEASAAAMRSSAMALGALAVFATLLFVREWPIALTGSIWAVGTLLAAALWFLRARYRPEWFSSAHGLGSAGATRRTGLGAGSIVGRQARLSIDSDPDAVLASARSCFLCLQAAWDAADVEELKRHTTEEMLAELLQELPLRGPGPNRTDVVTLNAALLALEELGSRYVASVEFSGMIRESPEQGAAPFKEVWMLTCPKDEIAAWRLARHQALL